MSELPTTPSPAANGTAKVIEEQWHEALNDGSRVFIRPIYFDDRTIESDFIKRLSPDARHFRFLGALREASPTLLDQLVNVDYASSMAFVALIEEHGKTREVGVARYNGSADRSACECAVTVADDWQHRGLAVVLMRHLIEVARRNGFKNMFSLDAAANEPMHELANYLGFTRTRDPDDATQVLHRLAL